MQHDYYGKLMPETYNGLQLLEEQRVNVVKDCLMSYSAIVHTSIPTTRQVIFYHMFLEEYCVISSYQSPSILETTF